MFSSFATRAMRLACAWAVAAAAACGDAGPASDDASAAAIRAGAPATDHEEVALVDIAVAPDKLGGCSGALIAPRVVLTAGHCVAGFREFVVRLPYAGGQAAPSSEGAVFDYPAGSQRVARDRHDIGLIFLPRPLRISRYPVLASVPIASNARLTTIGRRNEATASRTDLYESPAFAAEDAAPMGAPAYYRSPRFIDAGDSGGPVVVAGSFPARIVGVNSGTGADYQLLARVDLLFAWIHEQIGRHGGATLEDVTCAARETEPNDTPATATPTSEALCGAVSSPLDTDFIALPAPAPDARVGVRATGGVRVRLLRLVGTGAEVVPSDDPTGASEVALPGARYVAEVRAAGAEPSAYVLDLSR